jgi:putative sigma-54 modulation protein
MRIDIKARAVAVNDELRERVERRFEKVSRQVSEAARLELHLSEETPGRGKGMVAEAALHLKGVTLRAREDSEDVVHSINLVADDLSRQVKRHRDKRRHRRDAGVEPRPAAG